MIYRPFAPHYSSHWMDGWPSFNPAGEPRKPGTAAFNLSKMADRLALVFAGEAAGLSADVICFQFRLSIHPACVLVFRSGLLCNPSNLPPALRVPEVPNSPSPRANSAQVYEKYSILTNDLPRARMDEVFDRVQSLEDQASLGWLAV